MCKPQCISFLVENKIQSLVHLGSVMQQSPRDAVVTFIAREWAFTGKQANDLWECAINAADKALFGQAPSRILQRVAPTEQRTEAPHCPCYKGSAKRQATKATKQAANKSNKNK
jgi:hypothetical protein